MTLYIIYNPSSGNGRAKELVKTIQLSYTDLSYVLYPTRYKDDELVQIAAILVRFEPLKDRLMIIGGDGTLSKCLSQWPIDYPFAYLPAGSGNDFARSLGGLTIKQVMTALLSDSPQAITLLKGPDCLVVNSLDVAYAATVVALSEESRLKGWCNRLALGHLSYALLGIKALFVTKPLDLSLTSSNQSLRLDNLFFFSVANNTSFGGGVTIWPSSHVSKPELVCVWAKNRGLFGNLWTLLTLLFKKQESSHHFGHLISQDIQVTFGQSVPVQIDGNITQLSQVSLEPHTRYLYY